MDARKRLKLRFTPDRLGIEPAALDGTLAALISLANDVATEDEAVYQAALALGIDMQIAALLDQPEVFSASGQVSVTQGLAVKLRQLRGERNQALRAAGLPVPGPQRAVIGTQWIPVIIG